ncbi:MAG: hypothetical protein U1E30_04590 [Rhodoblastus sp.]
MRLLVKIGGKDEEQIDACAAAAENLLDRLRQIEKPVGVVVANEYSCRTARIATPRNASIETLRLCMLPILALSRARRIEANYERRTLRGTRMADAFAQSRIDGSRAAFTKRAGSVASSSMRTS